MPVCPAPTLADISRYSGKKGRATGNYENAGNVATVNRSTAASGVVPTGAGGRYQIMADNTLVIPAVREEDAGTYYCGVGLGNNIEIHGATELVITTDGTGKVIGGVVGGLVGVGFMVGFTCLNGRKLHQQEGDDLTGCQLIGKTIRTTCSNPCYFLRGYVSTQRDVVQEEGSRQIAMQANPPCRVVDMVKEYESKIHNQ